MSTLREELAALADEWADDPGLEGYINLGEVEDRLRDLLDRHPEPDAESRRCPTCRHMPHGDWCPNMASDNDCNCTDDRSEPFSTHPEPEAFHCTTQGCPGDYRYGAPGRGHLAGCTYPSPEPDAPTVDEVRALADALNVHQDGPMDWYEGQLLARIILAAGYRSPTQVAEAVQQARAEALREAAHEMECVIADGDVAEVAAPVEGEVGRYTAIERRDALYNDPATWLSERADRIAWEAKP